jgi:hypothetical protein
LTFAKAGYVCRRQNRSSYVSGKPQGRGACCANRGDDGGFKIAARINQDRLARAEGFNTGDLGKTRERTKDTVLDQTDWGEPSSPPFPTFPGWWLLVCPFNVECRNFREKQTIRRCFASSFNESRKLQRLAIECRGGAAP